MKPSNKCLFNFKTQGITLCRLVVLWRFSLRNHGPGFGLWVIVCVCCVKIDLFGCADRYRRKSWSCSALLRSIRTEFLPNTYTNCLQIIATICSLITGTHSLIFTIHGSTRPVTDAVNEIHHDFLFDIDVHLDVSAAFKSTIRSMFLVSFCFVLIFKANSRKKKKKKKKLSLVRAS
jgi:hypothetical protein